ncbi:hypothetical protein F5Y13DRAFT_172606 [Hypoxylon sp. FL1857]|nr:hypothetical protein F5Y13DRAFT_172606 [Hypoxylon sp. FL1857]
MNLYNLRPSLQFCVCLSEQNTQSHTPARLFSMASSKDQSAEERYGLFCPSGGSFYTCIHTQIRFLGCCETDPCSNGGECPVDQLRPASYANYSGPHQSCVAPYDEGEWYTCDDATPKFMGCCTQDPCNNGCPNANLIPARLDDDDGLAAPFLSQPTSSTSTSTTNSSAPSRTETVADTGTPSGELVTEPSHTASSRSIGLIVGLSMMGVVILLIIIGIILWWKRRRNVWESNNQEDRRSSSSRNENENQNKTTSQNVLQTGEWLEFNGRAIPTANRCTFRPKHRRSTVSELIW